MKPCDKHEEDTDMTDYQLLSEQAQALAEGAAWDIREDHRELFN